MSRAAAVGYEFLEVHIHRLAVAGRLRLSAARAAELVHSSGCGTVLTLLAAPAGSRDLELSKIARERPRSRRLQRAIPLWSRPAWLLPPSPYARRCPTPRRFSAKASATFWANGSIVWPEAPSHQSCRDYSPFLWSFTLDSCRVSAFNGEQWRTMAKAAVEFARDLPEPGLENWRFR